MGISKGNNIIVKDYLYKGNYIFGHFEVVKNDVVYYILDDGDIYSLKDLENEGYKYALINSKDIIEKFKGENEIFRKK